MFEFFVGAAILVGLFLIHRSYEAMTEALDRLKREVEESNTATASALTLIAGLADQIRNSVDDSDALNALAESLDAQQAELAAAVTANTPEAPAPVGEDTTAGGADTQPADEQ